MKSITRNQCTYTPLNNYKEYFLYALIYIAFVSLMPHSGHGGDLWCWRQWSCYILKNGIENIYYSGSNYPPLYYYVLQWFGSFLGSEESIGQYIFMLKPITLFFEFCSVFILFKFVTKELRPWVFLFIMLNPGFFYNNLIWGQVDGIVGFLLISTIVLVIQRQNTLALLVYILCLNFKIQSIIYLPLFIFLLIHNLADYKGIRYTLLVLMSMICAEILVILPYIKNDTVELLFNTLLNSVDQYPKASMNAYNCWYWFFEKNPIDVEDKERWMHFTYKSWGLMVFFLSSVLALIPVFITSIFQAFNKTKTVIKNIDGVFLSAALITLLFFFFNTQMHERYSHYCLIFLAGYFAVTGNYLPFLLASMACFLNMEAVLKALALPNYSNVLFTEKYIAGLYLLVIIYLYYLIYKNSNWYEHMKPLMHAFFQKRRGVQ